MGIIRNYTGTGLSTSPLGTGIAGPGDTAWDIVAGDWSIDTSRGVRPPVIRLIKEAGISPAIHWTSLGSLPASSGRVYIQLSGAPSGTVVMLSAIDSNDARIFDLALLSTARLRLHDASNAQIGSLPVMNLNQPYRIEWIMTTSMVEVHLYEGDSTTSLGSVTWNGTVAPLNRFKLTLNSSSVTVDPIDFDDIALSNEASFIGPVSPISAFSGHSGTANITSLNVTIPLWAKQGDVAVIMFGTNSAAATFTTPSGWTLLAGPTTNSSNNQNTVIVARKLGSGEAGTTVTGTWSVGGRASAAGLLFPNADLPTGTPVWWSSSPLVSSVSAGAVTGMSGGTIAVFGYKLVETAGTDPLWSSSALTEHVDITTTNASGRRFGAWAGTVAATGSEQGPFEISLASTGSGSGYSVAIPVASSPSVTPIAFYGEALTPVVPWADPNSDGNWIRLDI